MLAILAHYGLMLIFLNVLLEQLGAPLPALPTLIAAGALIAAGTLDAGATVVVAFLASSLADIAWYVAGRRYGRGVMRLLCRVALAPDSCVRQTEDRFGRWGAFTLLISKFIPGLATIARPVAGALGVGWVPFLTLSSAGTLLWIGVGVGAGIVLRDQIEMLLDGLSSWGSAALLVVAALFAVYALLKFVQRRRFMHLLRMARIPVDELRRLIDEGRNPLIVDVRSDVAKALDPRIIPGATLLDIATAEAHLEQFPADREIVFYCTCPNDAGAAYIAKRLQQYGYRRVRPLHGGLDAWIAAGYATETSAPPASGDATLGIAA